MKISVALCTYNGARYVAEQLESIASQTRPPDELVVCDDRSSDATVQILEAFAARAPFPVHIHVNESNLRSTRNFEKAIGLCTGDVIALSDQDDVWLPEKLERTEAILHGRPQVGLVFTDAEVVSEALEPMGYRLWESVKFDAARQARIRDGDAFALLFQSYVVTGATMAFRARFRDLILPIPEGTHWIHDGWIALLVSAVAEVAFIPEPMLLYRQHSSQQLGAAPPQADIEMNLSLADEVEISRSVTRSDYLAGSERIAPVATRLREFAQRYPCGPSLELATARTAHLRARGTLPAARALRPLHVLRELSTRRYHRFGRGFYSALKDLWVK